MTTYYKTDDLKRVLETISQVRSVDDIKFEDNIIIHISIDTGTIGRVTVHQLEVNDAPELFEFYTEGLTETPRRLFAPYPLFHTPPYSVSEMAERIAEWKKEKDWSSICLTKDKQIIGFCLLKRFYTENVTSGIAVRDDFLKKGLGRILQSIIIEQARLLNLKSFHIKVVSDNLASVRLHEKCGFRQTRILPPPMYEEVLQYLSAIDKKEGKKAVERHIIEMVIDLEPKTKRLSEN